MESSDDIRDSPGAVSKLFHTIEVVSIFSLSFFLSCPLFYFLKRVRMTTTS